MSKVIIAIDPGSSSGAIAVRRHGLRAGVQNMPDTPEGIYRYLTSLADIPEVTVVYIENVGGSMPGNAAKSARTFATHMGHLEMACIALRLKVVKVAPRTWMGKLFGDEYPKNPKRQHYEDDTVYRTVLAAAKKLRKQFIMQRMQTHFPNLLTSQRQADALAILLYAMRKENGEL